MHIVEKTFETATGTAGGDRRHVGRVHCALRATTSQGTTTVSGWNV
jgi:hypothetical protein